MADLVVTVPKERWDRWLAEGDLPGEPWTGREHRFWIGWRKPGPWRAGDRVYVVARGRVRGYAPLVRVEREPVRGYGLVRGGGAVAVTIPQEVRGFRGVRARWWNRSEEIPWYPMQGPTAGTTPGSVGRGLAPRARQTES